MKTFSESWLKSGFLDPLQGHFGASFYNNSAFAWTHTIANANTKAVPTTLLLSLASQSLQNLVAISPRYVVLTFADLQNR